MSTTRPSLGDKRRAFHSLHEKGCFLIPNPWDVGSACWLQGLGFQALASTSSGFAWSQGRADTHTPRDAVLRHLADLVAATDLPVNADFENGFATDAAGVGDSVRAAVETGIAGVSIEDSTGDAAHPLFDLPEALARLRAARQAIDKAGGEVLLVARAECFLVGRADLAETTARLRAYADAGADCLYAPGIGSREQIAAIVEAVAPKPVNVLVSNTSGGWTLDALAALGVRRVSIGGALARAAWAGFMHAARLLAEQGRFDGLAGAASGRELDTFFAADAARRSG